MLYQSTVLVQFRIIAVGLYAVLCWETWKKRVALQR